MKFTSYTKKALTSLLLPLIHVAAFILIMLLGSFINSFTHDASVLVGFLITVAILLMLLFPLIQAGSSIYAIVQTLLAMRKNETTWLCIVPIIIACFYLVTAAVYVLRMCEGLISV